MNKGTLAVAASTVLLTYPATDRAFADRVAELLRADGLQIIDMTKAVPDQDWREFLQQSLAESGGIVVAWSSPHKNARLPSEVMVEIGAVGGAGKPIFVVVDDYTATLPFGVRGLQILPFDRAGEIADRLAT